MFYSENYANLFCGTALNGIDLPTGTYYYLIVFNKEANPNLDSKRGTVTIIR